MQFFQQLAEKWANWLGDRDLELALRKHLNEQGFYGDTAKLTQLRLVAVQRPGWLQVYTFVADTRSQLSDAPPQRLLGILRQDERYNRLEIRLFNSAPERNRLFEQWSEDLVRLRGAAGRLGSS